MAGPGVVGAVVGVEQVRGAVQGQADRVAHGRAAGPGVLGGDRRAVGQAQIDQGAVAQALDELDLGVDQARARRDDLHGLGPQAQAPGGAGGQGGERDLGVDARAAGQGGARQVARAVAQRHVQEAHRRRADEGGHEAVGGAGVDLHRRADLLDLAVAHHHDAVGQGHGLDLVVGDQDHRRLNPAAQLGQLQPGAHAQGGVEVGQRLVEQEQVRLLDDGPADGDALALAARQLAGLGRQEALDLQDAGRLGHARLDLGLRDLRVAQAERHVLEDRHVRIEGVVLEHHATPRSPGARASTRRSPMWISPVSTVSSPAIIRSRVDLPQPEGPRKAMNSPDAMSRRMSSSTATEPKLLLR
jgi:hypothetical protein